MDFSDPLLLRTTRVLRQKSAAAALRHLAQDPQGPTIQGLPGPLALMLAGEDGWLYQKLLSDTGKEIASSSRVLRKKLADRYVSLAQAASKGPHAKAQLALAWLGAQRRVEHPARNHRQELGMDFRMVWKDVHEKIDALAKKVGLGTSEDVLIEACAQLDGRWGDHTGGIACLVARSVVAGASYDDDRAWLTALSVMRAHGYCWNVDGEGGRTFVRGGIGAVGNRVGHACHYWPSVSSDWLDILGEDATTEVLAQCWAIACQPDNPAVKVILPDSTLATLSQAWGDTLARHLIAHPNQAHRVEALVNSSKWHDVETLPGMEERLVAMILDASLAPSASPASSPTRPRL